MECIVVRRYDFDESVREVRCGTLKVGTLVDVIIHSASPVMCTVTIKESNVTLCVPRHILALSKNENRIFVVSEILGENEFEMTCTQTGEVHIAHRHMFPNLKNSKDFIRDLQKFAYHYFPGAKYFNDVPGGLGIPERKKA